MTAHLERRLPFRVETGGGESVWSLGGRFTVKADAAVTEDRFSLLEVTAYRSTEPPLHIHHHEDEAWYVLDGHMTVFVGDEALEAPAGTFVFAPRGLPHNFTVDVEPTRVLALVSPAGFEHFVLELGEPAREDPPPPGLAIPGPDAMAPFRTRYGIEVLGPPRRAAGGASEGTSIPGPR
jgi:mannose-6-phosphate isomerase-like protein (cupin superfamily)